MGQAESEPYEEHWTEQSPSPSPEPEPQPQPQNKSDAQQLSNKEVVEGEGENETLNEDDLREEQMWIAAISQDPRSAHLRNQLANHYFSRSRLSEAEFAYKAAIDLDKKSVISHYDFAFMRHHQFYWALSRLKLQMHTSSASPPQPQPPFLYIASKNLKNMHSNANITITKY